MLLGITYSQCIKHKGRRSFAATSFSVQKENKESNEAQIETETTENNLEENKEESDSPRD